MRRTMARWVGSLLLGIGLGVLVLLAAGLAAVARPAAIPPGVAFLAVAIVVALGASAWLIRITRSLTEEPPPWRYRDR